MPSGIYSLQSFDYKISSFTDVVLPIPSWDSFTELHTVPILDNNDTLCNAFQESSTFYSFLRELLPNLSITTPLQRLSHVFVLMSILLTIRMTEKVCYMLIRFCFIVASFAVVFALLPVLCFVGGIFFTYHCLVRYLLYFKYGNTACLMQGTDVVWALDDPRWRSIINVLMTFEGSPDIAHIRKLIFERVLMRKLPNGNLAFPKLFQSLQSKFGYFHWKDIPFEQFKIEDYVKLMSVKSMTEEDLANYVSSTCNEPIGDEGKANWEVIVVPEIKVQNSDEAPKYAFIFRIHHSIGDGISLLRLLMTSLSDEPFEFSCQPIRSSMTNNMLNESILSVFQTLGHILLIIIMSPYSLIRQILKCDSNNLHGAQLSGDKIVRWVDVANLDILKHLKDRTQSRMSDVLLTTVSSSLTYQLSPCTSHVTAVIPALVSPPTLFPRKDGCQTNIDDFSLVNKFSVALLTLPTPAFVSPVDRLRQVGRSCDGLRSSPDFIINYWLLSLVITVLPSAVVRPLLSRSTSTVVVSNLPGPSRHLTVGGYKLTDIYFWVPNRGQTGMGISILSYAGKVRAGVIVDSALVSFNEQVDLLANGLSSAVDGLVADLDHV